MRFSAAYSHHNGEIEWARRGMDTWLRGIFDAPTISVDAGSTSTIRKHVRHEMTCSGWSNEFNIAQNTHLTLFASKDDLAFHMQTGNISRAPYDLLKLQYLYISGRIHAAGLALPSKRAAARLGDNLANAERIWSELCLFERVITVPIFVIAFE